MTLQTAFHMSRIVVGSLNPVKVAAVKAVLARVRSDIVVTGIAVESGVPAQPWGDDETQEGARARARAALLATDAELAIGLEGGVVELADGSMRTCAWAAALDRAGRSGLGGSLSMPLPDVVSTRLRGGEELGAAMDAVAQVVGTSQGRGAVGILTTGLVDRQRAYEPMIAYALAPWLASAFYASGGR